MDKIEKLENDVKFLKSAVSTLLEHIIETSKREQEDLKKLVEELESV